MNELVLRESDKNKIQTYSEYIRSFGTTLLGLVNDILDISEIESGRSKMIKSNYGLSYTINELANIVQTDTDSRGIGFELDINSETPKMLCGDETHLRQILMNLLNNAVNSTTNGVVTLGVNYHDISDSKESIMLDVTIKSSGTGQSPAVTDKSGSSNESTYDMQGLSVNVAESFLKMMGTSLNTEIENGTGLVLSFSIEQKVISHEPIGDYEESYRSDLKKRKAYRRKFRAPKAAVLVADDIPVNLMLLSKLLESSEIHADTALSGIDAIKLAKENKYDIIILDQIMPEKSGVETLREIRSDKNSPNCLTPAVCLTANAVPGAREQYIGEGFDDYLPKPLDTEHLDEVLLRYIPEEKIEHLSTDK